VTNGVLFHPISAKIGKRPLASELHSMHYISGERAKPASVTFLYLKALGPLSLVYGGDA